MQNLSFADFDLDYDDLGVTWLRRAPEDHAQAETCRVFFNCFSRADASLLGHSLHMVTVPENLMVRDCQVGGGTPCLRPACLQTNTALASVGLTSGVYGREYVQHI